MRRGTALGGGVGPHRGWPGDPSLGEHGRMPTTGQAADTTDRRLGPSTARSKPVSLASAVLGLALTATGIVAVFTTESDGGAAALLTIGAIFMLLAALGDRLESLRYGDLELVLRRKA